MNDGRQVPQGSTRQAKPGADVRVLPRRHREIPGDRDAVAGIVELVPEIRDAAWANRGFLQPAVRWMAERGIRQFIDLGAGLRPSGSPTR